MPQSRMVMATTTPAKAATDPTERSIWPAMITSTMPIARIRMYALPLNRLMTLVGVRVLPPVCHWKKRISAIRAKIIPNCRVLPPNIRLREFMVRPRGFGQADFLLAVMSFIRDSWLASSRVSSPVMEPSKMV